jgi:hypothetical protein
MRGYCWRCGSEVTEIPEQRSPSHMGLGEPSLHNNICSTPSHLVQEGMVNTTELCSSSDGGLSMQEESAPKVASALEVSGWQRIMTEIITMAEALALNDVA